MEESVSKRRRDRFSELPNSLIHRILSFLPIRDVVSTTILSKRWKNLWTTVPCLNFSELSESCEDEELEKIRSFVNRALLFWRGVGNLKFKIDFIWDFDNVLGDDIDLWVRFAVEKNVEELSIRLNCEEMEEDMNGDYKCIYCAPVCLNSCSSIRELSLVGCNLRIPVKPSWNQLKSLKIDGYCFGERLISRILLGSPQLEVFELRLVESDENLSIRSTSLKKLKIDKFVISECDEPSKNKVLRICCPNLEILAISGVMYSKYLFTNVSSVTDVTLGFNGSYDYPYGNDLLEDTLQKIFSTFQHVHKVTLSYWCIQVLGMLQQKYLLSSLPYVKFFPNLKMLVIKDQTRYEVDEFDAIKDLWFEAEHFDTKKYLEFETKLSVSFMLQLKTVDITSSVRNASTLRFIEFLLKDACMLEKLVIRVTKIYSEDWFKVAEGLLSMPRSSPTAKVIQKRLMVITGIVSNHIEGTIFLLILWSLFANIW